MKSTLREVDVDRFYGVQLDPYLKYGDYNKKKSDNEDMMSNPWDLLDEPTGKLKSIEEEEKPEAPLAAPSQQRPGALRGGGPMHTVDLFLDSDLRVAKLVNRF